MPPHTVLLIRSASLAWDGLRRSLAVMPDIRLVGDVSDTNQALALVGELVPDLVVTAAEVADGLTLLELVSALRERSPDSRFAVIVDRVDQVAPTELLALQGLSVEGQLLWSEVTPDRFQRCLLDVVEDNLVVASREVAEAFLDALRRRTESPYELPALTPREIGVLKGLAQELSHPQIARVEGISVRTVKRTIADLHLKFGTSFLFTLALKATSLRVIP